MTERRKPQVIPVGLHPVDIAEGDGKNYVVNAGSNTVSVIDIKSDEKEHDISVGFKPSRIAYDPATNMIYVAQHAGTVSVLVIDGSSDKVAAGIIFIQQIPAK